MKYTELPGIKKELSAIYLGTGNYGSDISPSESFKLLDRFAELGGTFIDTAHVYGAWDTSGYNGGYGNSDADRRANSDADDTSQRRQRDDATSC